MLNTVARTGKVLALFTHERPEWGVTEVSAALGLPKSNAHEMLSSLTVIGLLQRTAESRYRLGWRLLAISHNLVRTGGLERASGIILATLSRRVGVTSHVGAWDGRRIICVSGTTGSSQLALPRHPVGTRLPGHSTALGKMLLAHLTAEQVAERVQIHGLPRLTTSTVSSPDALSRQLEHARSIELAHDAGETYDSVSCVAAPVRDADGCVVVAVSVSVRTSEMVARADELASAVRGAARQLSRRLMAEHVAEHELPPNPLSSPVS